jgi:NTP pyrophosphatase (non-canonical NTP hydrolase)
MNQPINNVVQADVDQFVRDYCDYEHSDNALDDYQRLAVRSAIYPGKGTPFGLMYAALGLAEAGEVQNKVKKIFRDDGVIELHPTGSGTHETMFHPVSAARKCQIAKEIGGLLWYAAACCNELGITLSEVAAGNLKELASRSQRGTLQGDGDDR